MVRKTGNGWVQVSEGVYNGLTDRWIEAPKYITEEEYNWQQELKSREEARRKKAREDYEWEVEYAARQREEREREREERERRKKWEAAEEEKQRRMKYAEEVDNKYKKIAAGPRRRTLREKITGYDPNQYDVDYLYGLASDILALMMDDQRVKEHKERKDLDERNIENMYEDFHSQVYEYEVETLLKKYGANSVEDLLKKYDEIRKKYYKYYLKLNKELQQEYKASESTTVFKNLKHSVSAYVFEAENFAFPPTSEQLVDMINRRILNAKRYYMCEKESSLLKEVENFTKNMSIEQTVQLYHNMKSSFEKYDMSYLREPGRKENYQKNLQKVFCTVILNKQGNKKLDKSQENSKLEEIAETLLKESSLFSDSNLNEIIDEESREKSNTIYKEYIKYLAGQQDKKNAMKFPEYVQKKYGYEVIILTEEMQQQLDENGKGMKK